MQYFSSCKSCGLFYISPYIPRSAFQGPCFEAWSLNRRNNRAVKTNDGLSASFFGAFYWALWVYLARQKPGASMVGPLRGTKLWNWLAVQFFMKEKSMGNPKSRYQFDIWMLQICLSNGLCFQIITWLVPSQSFCFLPSPICLDMIKAVIVRYVALWVVFALKHWYTQFTAEDHCVPACLLQSNYTNEGSWSPRKRGWGYLFADLKDERFHVVLLSFTGATKWAFLQFWRISYFSLWLELLDLWYLRNIAPWYFGRVV